MTVLVAAIGIGSNSLRMLIADIRDAQLHRILRDREGLRVFAAFDAHKNISREMMDKAARAVGGFVEKARALRVERIHVFATSAVRDARNQRAFCERIQAATGFMPEVCSGDLEAMLAFRGAVETDRAGVIDIGGGSTEIVVGTGGRIEYATSLQMGAVRLFRKLPMQSVSDAYRAVDSAAAILAPVAEGIARRGCVSWVGVGGTLTTLAALLQDISWTEKKRIHGYHASATALQSCMERLAPMSVQERSALAALQPQRADIVVHGMAILLACMRALDIGRITVSECGNLEGYLKYKYAL